VIAISVGNAVAMLEDGGEPHRFDVEDGASSARARTAASYSGTWPGPARNTISGCSPPTWRRCGSAVRA
jgi:hypothetical protein